MTQQDFIQAGFSVLGTEEAENNLLSFLKQHYPSVIRDSEINLEELKTVLGMPIDEKVNGYGLNFVGRNFARAKYTQKTEKELQLNTTLSKNIDTTQNLVLKGDNLDSLKILKSHYTGKIKCIYIDPPYNTTKDEFIYPDKFDKEEAEVLGLVNLNESDFDRMDFSFKTKKSHNGWLAFMYPRLLLAKDLLSQDGVIFISIDDNEQANLKLLCDDIFGEDNFIGMFSVENNPKGRKNSKFISVSNEYCLSYAKNLQSDNGFRENIPKLEKDLLVDSDGRKYSPGKRVLVGESSNPLVNNEDSRKNYSVYFDEVNNIIKVKTEKITDEHSKKYPPTKFTRYRSIKAGKLLENTYTQEEFLNLFNQQALIFKSNSIYEKDFNEFIRIKSLLVNNKALGLDFKTETANSDLHGVPFSNPKNIRFIRTLVTLLQSKEDILLDFFAGSGSTAHAIMQLNADDGGNRKFILCQIDEPIKKTDPGYQFCIDNNLPPVVSSFTVERLKRAGDKIKSEIEAENSESGMFDEHKKQVPDIGYKVFDSVEAQKLQVDEHGQISISENHMDSLSRIYNMIFTVGLDEPSQVPETVVEDCIYKIGNNYYITNSEKISPDDFANVIKKGKVYIDGWTASLNGTLQHYKDDVKIIF